MNEINQTQSNTQSNTQSDDISTQPDSTPVSGRPKRKPLTRAQHVARWFEIVTAIMLGVVAVATAWSGYQSARWGSVGSTRYAEASALRLDATRDSTLAGQLRLYDLILTNNWINAYTSGNIPLANIYESRFRPEFLPVFKAWLALNPFHNPSAPAGPLFMPQYKVSLDTEASQLNAQAEKTFTAGQVAIEHSDDYVLNTVFLATVLFLTAIAERFEWNKIRAVILVFALVMLAFGIYHLIIYPIT